MGTAKTIAKVLALIYVIAFFFHTHKCVSDFDRSNHMSMHPECWVTYIGEVLTVALVAYLLFRE